MTRRTQEQLAAEAEAKVRKERARLELSEIKARQEKVRLGRDTIKARRKMLAVHRAAEVNRLTNDWPTTSTSADSAIIPDMARTNARARLQVYNDAWARSIVRSFRRNRIGTGITPAIDDKPYRRDWNGWANDPERCDIEGKRTFAMIQQWASDEEVTVGECFVVRWIIGGELKLQCFEFEQLDQYKLVNQDTGNEIRHGIEVDSNGKAVGYWFYRHHPNDIRGLARPAPLTLESFRVPASMVCHMYDPDRVRQTHGISRLAPVLRKLRDLAEYDAAQLRVARAEASIGLLIKGGDDGNDPLQLDGLNVAYVDDAEDITPFIPSRPGNTYDPFVRMQVMQIAAGVGLSGDQVMRNFDGGSFSSKRQGAIEDRREFAPMQQRTITQLCSPVMDDFVFAWNGRNIGQSGAYFLDDTPERIDWQGQGWEWVDPEQQGKGVERMMRLGLTTRTIEANLLGTTVEKLDEQMAKDGTRETLANLQPDKRENPSPDGPTSPSVDIKNDRVGEVADAA
ncbi:MAG: phage portal protein [Phycisphaerales bacterium JB063]